MSNLKKKFYRVGYIYKYRVIFEENAKNILREFDNNHHNHNNYLMDEMNFRPDLMFRSMHDLVYNRKISEVVKQILGPKVVSWYSLLFYKRKKKFVSFHQDLKYWQFKNETCLTVPVIKKNFDERSLKIRENLLQKTISHQMRGKNIKFLNLFEFIYTSFFFRRLFYFFKSFK